MGCLSQRLDYSKLVRQITLVSSWIDHISSYSKVQGANMGPTWVLPAPDGPHVGPMKLAIVRLHCPHLTYLWLSSMLVRDQIMIQSHVLECKKLITFYAYILAWTKLSRHISMSLAFLCCVILWHEKWPGENGLHLSLDTYFEPYTIVW